MYRIIVLLVWLMWCLFAYANDDLTIALSAYERGDYQSAYELFTQLAQEHNPEAQYNLAFMYFGGEGIEQDDAKAAYWFEQAARAGHAAAQDTLAYMYLNGRGLKTDRVQAYAWYSVAAYNGIFLAKNVSENIKKQMGPAEQVHADLLTREYIKKYKK